MTVTAPTSPPPPYSSYMICTTPRSGSTLLCTLLEATGAAGRPGSHFHTPDLDRWLEVYALAEVAFASEREKLAAIFDAARKRGCDETGMFGLRMQRGSFPFFIEQVGRLHPECSDDRSRLEAAFGPMLFLHLSRADKLDQAISRLKAEQTGLWHKAADGTELERVAPAQPLVYDRDAIARHLDELSALEAAWEAWFAEAGIDPLIVTYDGLAQDPTGSLAMILRALGRDPALAQGIAPPVAKLADATNRDWADRFRKEIEGR